MKFTPIKNDSGKVTGYNLSLSASETYAWAQAWPCSQLSGRSCWVAVDSNGICDGDGTDAGYELEALISDFLPTEARHLWPVWGQDKA